MLDPLGQAWQNGSGLAAQTPGRANVNKHRLCGSLLQVHLSTLLFSRYIKFQIIEREQVLRKRS